tara:strand:+ start:31992 stop:32651 length:660 start_codon:yes stop_codon:yes gene_type:complete
MAKSFLESVQIHGGLSGQFYDLNVGPQVDGVCDSLLQNAATSNLEEDAPIYLGSSGNLSADRTLTLDATELPGRLFFLHVENDDIESNSLTFTSSGTVNDAASATISDVGDYLLTHKASGDWRLQSLWSIDNKLDLELELEFKLSNLSNFKELLYTGNNLISVNIYEDNTKTTLLFAKSLAYTGNNLTSTLLTRASDGATLSKALIYSGSRLISVETIA